MVVKYASPKTAEQCIQEAAWLQYLVDFESVEYCWSKREIREAKQKIRELSKLANTLKRKVQ